MSFSEESFVAACVASWLGLDKRLPASASHGMLDYQPFSLWDKRRAEQVARVIRKGKALAVVYNPHAGQRYGSWGRSGDCVASMFLTAWQSLNTDKRNVLVKCRDLGGEPAAIVARLARENDYAGALALAPFAGVKKRDIPLPVIEDVGGRATWYAEQVKRRAESAADYLVPELAKIRRKKEREAREENKRAEERRRREWIRLKPYNDALWEARNRLYNLQNSIWSLETLLGATLLDADIRDAVNNGGAVFKVTFPGGVPCSGGNKSDTWPLPKDGKPGDWTPNRAPSVCGRGWHLATPCGVSQWIKPGTAQELWFAGGQGSMSRQSDKVAFESARLVRLLAAGDLGAMGKPALDTVAIEAAKAAVAQAESELAFASQGY